MRLLILKINGVLYYSHHKSNLYPGVWYKEYKKSGSFRLIYNEITNGLAVDKPYKTTKGTLIEIVEGLDFWEFVNQEQTQRVINMQLNIAI